MPEKDNKLYIVISDKRGEDGGKPTPTLVSSNEQIETQQESSVLARYAEHELFHLVKSTATQAVNFSINNIGNFTGDYIAQRQVNYAKGVASNVMSVGMTTIAGAKLGGPIGAVIGFTVGVASKGISSMFEDMANRAEIAKMNFNISQLRDRVGLNTIYDGSRGTEN